MKSWGRSPWIFGRPHGRARSAYCPTKRGCCCPLTNAVGAGRMRQAARELVKAYIHGVESAALDDVFELLAWNQGIGFFSSEIGPSALFQAYKLIKNGEKQGKSWRISAVRCGRNSERRTRRCRSCIKSRELYKRLRGCGENALRSRAAFGLVLFAGAFFLLPLPFFHNRFIFSEFNIYFH